MIFKDIRFLASRRRCQGPRAVAHLLAALLWCAGLAPAQAGIYKCVDDLGHVTFQENACDGMAPDGQLVRLIENSWPAGGKHIFWKAESKFSKIYLLGSLHYGAPWIYPLPLEITDALESAEVLVVEADMLNIPPTQLAAKLAQHGIYHDGTRLEQVINSSNWTALNNLSRTVGLPLDAIEHQKPWLASMTLTSAALRQMGYSPDLGVDLHLMKAAARRIPIVELESVDYQLDLFEKMERDQQVAMLMQTMHELKDADRHFTELLESWLHGDADRLDRLIAEGFDTTMRGETLYNLMIVERNNAMMNTITRLTRKYNVMFIVVGAGHLVGKDGIIQQMKTAGYRIEQL